MKSNTHIVVSRNKREGWYWGTAWDPLKPGKANQHGRTRSKYASLRYRYKPVRVDFSKLGIHLYSLP